MWKSHEIGCGPAAGTERQPQICGRGVLSWAARPDWKNSPTIPKRRYHGAEDGANSTSIWRRSVSTRTTDQSSIKVFLIRYTDDLPMPEYATALSSGMDLRANLQGRAVTIEPRSSLTIGCGFGFEIPPGYEGQVRGRSGLASKHRISIEHGVGTIDADFRGEVQIILRNDGNEPYTIEHGNRIAQIVFAPVSRARLVEIRAASRTERGDGGLGSTGHA